MNSFSNEKLAKKYHHHSILVAVLYFSGRSGAVKTSYLYDLKRNSEGKLLLIREDESEERDVFREHEDHR
ncbi:MAG TPA: hypothetical protein PK335_07095 [Draconibacterium sp.]|nr:hypothetical protein [Draconibacterium sp.]